MLKVLVVEDDEVIGESIRSTLKTNNYTAELATNGADAVQLLENFSYDLILLDWDLPDLSGLEVLKRYRQSKGSVPVIFITGKSGLDNKELGLDSGADDYLTKPFEPRELLARIRTVTRRGRLLEPQLTYGALELDVNALTLKSPAGPISLTLTEAKLLKLFFENPTQVFPSQKIFEKIWSSESEAKPDTVRVHMHILRRKLALHDCKDLIATVPSVGYRLSPDLVK